MSPLQWSLLIFGAGIVFWLVYSSWRDKKSLEESRRPPDDTPRPRFGQDWDAQAEGKPFDEFGVSRPRKRSFDAAGKPAGAETGAAPVAPVAPVVPPKAPTVAAPPMPVAAKPARIEPTAAAPRAPGKLIAFYIAEHEGTTINGPKIHDALQSRGLKFGAKKIYHRLSGEQAVFSIASLTKPGTLDPADAAGFSTPGLSVFLQLPVAIPAVAAFEDMLDTAKSLARDLNAELFDSQQQALLTPERERELHAQVQDWARQHTGG